MQDLQPVSEEREGTEEQFLERYAERSRELQDEIEEEAENGQDEDGHEIELGMIVVLITWIISMCPTCIVFLFQHSAVNASTFSVEVVVVVFINCQSCPHSFGLLATGVLALVDQEATVLGCITAHGKRLLEQQQLPKELLARFKDKFPACKAALP